MHDKRINNKDKKTFLEKLNNFVYGNISTYTILIIILLSVAHFFVGTFAKLDPLKKKIFYYVQIGFTVFFTLELILKFIVDKKKSTFFIRNWILVVSLLPFFRILRIFRIIRLIVFVKNFRFFKRFHQSIILMSEGSSSKTYDRVVLFLMIIIMILASSSTIYYLEVDKPNTQIKTIFDGVWWTIVTITTVGYGDITPQSRAGKFLAMAIMFVGLGLFATIAGFISSAMVEKVIKKKEVDFSLFTNHYIICGWNENAAKIVNEIIKKSASAKTKFALLNQKTDNPLEINNVFHVTGDYTLVEMLQKVNIDRAKAIIILADKSIAKSTQDTDARTILTALAARNLRKDIFICTEILEKKNSRHMSSIGVNEIIVSGEKTGNIIAHSVLMPGVHEIIDDLLSTDKGNEFYYADCPKKFYEKEFPEVMLDIKKHNNAILIGIKRNNEINLNPDNLILKENDCLIFIAEKKPNI